MFNPKLDIIIHFVSNPEDSAKFYKKILGLDPIQTAPTFVLFVLQNGMQLGLWSSKTAEPEVLVKAGGSEICLNEADVDGIYQKWLAMEVAMSQLPTDMDFGRTFVALDPDGHRIRVYRLKEDSMD